MAAPPLKLKQSLLDSFLLRERPNHDGVDASADPPTPASPGVSHPSPSGTSVSTADAATEYERARQENIRRNRDFLQKLGIAAGPFGPKTAPPPQPRCGPKRRQLLHSSQESPPSSVLPVRRSTRKRPLPTPSPETAQEDAGGGSLEPLDPTYVDSSVFQYACEVAPEDVSSLASSSWSSPISGFKVTGKTLRDPSLAKIYAADVCRVTDEKVLVAACGHGGFISIFGVDLVEGEEEGGCDGTPERGVEGPLLSWKGSKSWASGVLFAEDNPMLLISSSNDGVVVVWDVSKQSSLASSSWSPPVVAESKGLHSGGIFSMHRRGCSIATASKDSSVGLHMLKMDGQLVAERTISGHHRGMIRGICFGY
ncbi:hypothetical protein Taro_053329 [Colocasia esculenta]|uniref:Uncharacterized protein n=1 Tax=Colocasia esculenta TaxID=4460 RepID=A0A843XMB1_COLES|nr:hypothetical protein [Colocasia esculenta]